MMKVIVRFDQVAHVSNGMVQTAHFDTICQPEIAVLILY
jgi:hypothetical protein